MATDLTHKEASGTTRIVGDNEVYSADVIFEDGLKKLAVSKEVQVSSLSGLTADAQNSFGWETVATGDTVTIEIDATPSSPAFSETFTVLAGEDRFDFASRIVLELNQDFVNFQPYHRASKVKDNSIIVINAKAISEAGENKAIDSFRVTGTGTLALTIYRQFDNYASRRSITVQASRSEDDGRIGIFGIQGTVTAISGDVSGIVTIQPYANGDPAQIDLNINASTGFVDFTFPMDALDDYFISEIRIFGLDSNISFGKFLGRNSAIPDALDLIIKTDNSLVAFPKIETTDDFADKFAGNNFDLYKQSGSDKFIASLQLQPFPLRRAGTFGVGNDDYLIIRVEANLQQVTKLQAQIIGVRREA